MPLPLSWHLLFLAVASGLFWLCVKLWRKRVLLRLLGAPAATPMLALFILYVLGEQVDGGVFGIAAVVLAYVYMAVLSLLCVLVQETLIP